MRAKVKNDPSRYVTRASLAGAVSDKSSPTDSTGDRVDQERRNAAGVLDQRWYLQLPPKRRIP